MKDALSSDSTSVEEIRSAIREHILEDCGGSVAAECLTYEASLIDLGIVDSLFMVSMLAFVDERFGLHIDPDDVPVERLDTIADIAELIQWYSRSGHSQFPAMVRQVSESEMQCRKLP